MKSPRKKKSLDHKKNKFKKQITKDKEVNNFKYLTCQSFVKKILRFYFSKNNIFPKVSTIFGECWGVASKPRKKIVIK